MKSVGIRELKNHLSRYLKQVQGGETLVVLDRDQPIAEIRKSPTGSDLAGTVARILNEESAQGRLIRAQTRPTLRVPSRFSQPERQLLRAAHEEAYERTRADRD